MKLSLIALLLTFSISLLAGGGAGDGSDYFKDVKKMDFKKSKQSHLMEDCSHCDATKEYGQLTMPKSKEQIDLEATLAKIFDLTR